MARTKRRECSATRRQDDLRRGIRAMRGAVRHVRCVDEIDVESRVQAAKLVGRNVLAEGLTWWGCPDVDWDGACVHAPGHAGEHDRWCL